MKTYRCSNCGFQVQRPTQPYRCPQCAKQAVGLFRPVQGAAQPTPPAAPPSQAPPPPPGVPLPPRAPAQSSAQPTPQNGPPPAPPAPPMVPAQPPSAPKQARPTSPPPQPAPPRETAPSQARRSPTPPGGQAAPPVQQQAASRPAAAAQPARRAKPPRTVLPAGKPADRPAAPASPRAAAQPAKPEPARPAPRVRPKPIRPQQFLWAYPEQPPYEDEARPMRNAPAVDSQGRMILCTQGRLVALAEEEGKAKVAWEYVTGSHVPGRIVVAADDTIRAHTSDGFLHCLTPAGKQAWSPAQVGEPLGWAAPVVDESGNTWISAYHGGLVRVSPEGKADRRPFFRTRSKLDSAAVIHNGVLYVGSEDGYVFAVQLGGDKGLSLWNHAAEQGYTGGFVNSSPAVADDGVLVVAAREETLWGFSPSGAAAWNTKVPGQVLGSPVIDQHGHIYVGVCRAERGQEPTGSLVCVDGNSHKIRWEYAAAGPVESTPVIGDDDVIYFGDNSGTLHALDGRGTALWTAKVESPIRSAGTIPAPERLAFGLDNDTLVVLRCSSKGLANAGWPKIGRTLRQSGVSQ